LCFALGALAAFDTPLFVLVGPHSGGGQVCLKVLTEVLSFPPHCREFTSPVQRDPDGAVVVFFGFVPVGVSPPPFFFFFCMGAVLPL